MSDLSRTGKPPPSPDQRLAMVHWFDPALLIRTGLHAMVAKYAGRYADRREILAALDPATEAEAAALRDYSAEADGLWFDYLADTGDGWDSTYAVACAVSAEGLDAGGESLPRGRFLVMGGDQIYPEARPEIYQRRMIAPFEAAFPTGDIEAAPDLFSIPGNHDWYDGLDAYADIFFRPRHKLHNHLGGWNIYQNRSYFALKLPQDWWLWGIDIQLSGSIDREQQSYFDAMAGLLEEGAKIILCAAEPDWVHAYLKPDHRPSALGEIVALAEKNGGDVRLVLSGDLHHYSRYAGPGENPRQHITCGGGGAFMHPTHVLPDDLADPFANPASPRLSLNKTYPERQDTHRHAWRNLGFPAFNLSLTVTLGVLYGLLGWLLHVRSLLDSALGQTGFESEIAHDSIVGIAWQFLRTLALSPEFAVVALIALAALVGFSPARPASRRFLHGGLHWVAQMMVLIVLFCGLVEINTRALGMMPDSPWFLLLLVLQMMILGGLFSALVFGAYLLISINGFKLHFTEAFSALRIADYKCFLRMHIDKAGVLRIYPMKIDKVPRTAGQAGPLERPSPEIIEPPIEVA